MKTQDSYLLCPTAEELAALYDKALPEKTCRALREHLVGCPRCCEDLRYLNLALERPRKEKLPRGAVRRFLEKSNGCAVRTQPARKNRMPFLANRKRSQDIF